MTENHKQLYIYIEWTRINFLQLCFRTFMFSVCFVNLILFTHLNSPWRSKTLRSQKYYTLYWIVYKNDFLSIVMFVHTHTNLSCTDFQITQYLRLYNREFNQSPQCHINIDNRHRKLFSLRLPQFGWHFDRKNIEQIKQGAGESVGERERGKRRRIVEIKITNVQVHP